jgi:putative ABC transport system ATP-binding protein
VEFPGKPEAGGGALKPAPEQQEAESDTLKPAPLTEPVIHIEMGPPAPPLRPAPLAHPVIRIENLTKYYYMGRNVVAALRGVSLEVGRGEFVAVMGPSGSGKSTLMNLIGCLDRPTGGRYELDGVPVNEMTKVELADIRNQKIGFIFQGFNLLARMSALENVALPLVYSLILADEPTGNLDSRTGLEVMMILQRLNARGITIVLVTHDPAIANYCRRQVKFRDGRIIEDVLNLTPINARDILAQSGHLAKKKVQP